MNVSERNSIVLDESVTNPLIDSLKALSPPPRALLVWRTRLRAVAIFVTTDSVATAKVRLRETGTAVPSSNAEERLQIRFPSNTKVSPV